MVNIEDVKFKLNKYKGTDGWYPSYSTRDAYDLLLIAIELLKEIEQLRADLKEMYEETKHVHSR